MLAARPGKRVADGDGRVAAVLIAVDADAPEAQQTANGKRGDAGIRVAVPLRHTDVIDRDALGTQRGGFDVGEAGAKFVQQVRREGFGIGDSGVVVLGRRILALAQADTAAGGRKLRNVGVEKLAAQVIIAEQIAVRGKRHVVFVIDGGQ